MKWKNLIAVFLFCLVTRISGESEHDVSRYLAKCGFFFRVGGWFGFSQIFIEFLKFKRRDNNR